MNGEQLLRGRDSSGSRLVTREPLHAFLVEFNFFAYAVPLANAMSELCEVTLMLPEQVQEHYRASVGKRVNLHLFRMPRLRYPTNLFMVRSLFQTMNRVEPDVVHQLSWHLWFNLALPLFPRIPLVTTIHDAKRHPGDKVSITLFTRQQWQRADRAIIHSEAIKEEVLEREPALENKVHVVPHGAYDFYTSWRGSVVEEDSTILFFGRIWEYKGLQYLIEAEPLITERIPDAKIVIAGSGEPFEKYEQMMVNRDRFVVHNYYIPDEMIASLFGQASVVVLPYIEASQSGILSIAFAFGKPVVASAVGGIPDVVEHGQTGYLVPPADSCALAESIVALLKDRTLRLEMGRRALAKAQNELSWASVAPKMIEVYQKAIDDWRQQRGRTRCQRA